MAKFALVILIVSVLSACKPDKLYGGEERLPYTLVLNDTAVIENIPGFLSWIPGRYNLPNDHQNYPVIIWFHGGGGFGNGKTELMKVTLTAEIMYKHATTNAYWETGNQKLNLVQIAPQFKKDPTNNEIKTFIEFLKTQYRIDTTRVYLVGFSLGGRFAGDFAAEFPNEIAALVTLAGCPGNSPNKTLEEKCQNMAAANLPVWSFHNSSDQTWTANDSKRFVSTLSSFNVAPEPTLTIFETTDGNHNAWAAATDPKLRINSKNIYQWMLSFHR